MAINVYKSTDTGAPTINNATGQLIGLLDACLVNGYSPGTVTSITRSGSTATLTFSADHGLTSKGHRLTIAGANEAEYNGTYNITVVNTTQISYTVSGTPATPATGTITATKPGAGWTIAYTGTNLRAYRMGAGNQRYLRVDDTGTTTARAVGYETMSDVDTGTGAFPTNAQIAGGLYWPKAGSAINRAWVLVASDNWVIYRTFYDGATQLPMGFFGDFTSRLSTTDNYNTLIIGETSSAATPGGSSVATDVNDIDNVIVGHYVPRDYTQIGTALQVGKNAGSPFRRTLTIGATGPAYPDPVSGNLLYSRLWITEPSTATTRGTIDYILCPLHARPLGDLDTFVGDGAYAGQTFMALNGNSGSQLFIRII